MTTEESIQGLREELRAEREARCRDIADHERCVSEMSRVLTGIEAALIGSVHSKERGIRETVNTHDTRLDDQQSRIKKLEDALPPCTGLSAEDVKKLKDMPAAADVKSGLSNVEKLMVYASLGSGAFALLMHFLKK